MSACDEIYEKLKKLGCTHKSGVTLRQVRGSFQSVSGGTLKNCVETWLRRGIAESCSACPCDGIKAVNRVTLEDMRAELKRRFEALKSEHD